MQGQTEREKRDGSKDQAGTGIIGRGASGAPSGEKPADESVDPRQRALERESGDLAGQKSDKADRAAEDMPNESA